MGSRWVGPLGRSSRVNGGFNPPSGCHLSLQVRAFIKDQYEASLPLVGESKKTN